MVTEISLSSKNLVTVVSRYRGMSTWLSFMYPGTTSLRNLVTVMSLDSRYLVTAMSSGVARNFVTEVSLDSRNLVKTFSKNLVTDVSLEARNWARVGSESMNLVTEVSLLESRNLVTVTSLLAWFRYLVTAMSSST